MSILYNCRHFGDQYRITKFNSEGDPEASYLCTFDECQCPAGSRPMCRHREMLPRFIQREAVDTGWMYDYDRGGWVDYRGWGDLPEGVEMFSLEDPIAVHNAIADAIGEPEAKIPAPARPKRKPDGRRL